LLEDLGLEDRLNWVNTRMGYFYEGKLRNWGDPFSLLAFPGLSLIDKARYAFKVLYCKGLKSFDELDKQIATDWLKGWLGPKGYKILWEPLMSLKFYELQDEVSAAWIAARVQRVAHSRESLFKEKTGYLTGCSEVLMQGLVKAIEGQGNTIKLSQPVKQVVTENGKATGVQIGNDVEHFDKVISTVPLPYVSKLVPDLPEEDHNKLAAIQNVGVVCLMFKLDRQFTPYFWLNINAPGIEMPGIIEYTNLNPLEPRQDGGSDHVLYVPYYMPQTNPKYSWDNELFYQEVVTAFKTIRPEFDESWIRGFHASRYFFAQPVCVPGYLDTLPPMDSAIDGFYMSDTSYYYPQDRSITESIKMAKQLVELAL
jgi:protoporphyrinogen oxidase